MSIISLSVSVKLRGANLSEIIDLYEKRSLSGLIHCVDEPKCSHVWDTKVFKCLGSLKGVIRPWTEQKCSIIGYHYT